MGEVRDILMTKQGKFSDRYRLLPELLFETLAGSHLEYHIQLWQAFVQKQKSDLQTDGGLLD